MVYITLHTSLYITYLHRVLLEFSLEKWDPWGVCVHYKKTRIGTCGGTPKKGGGTIFLVILNPLFVGPILSDLIHVFAHGLPPEFFFLRAPT